MKVVSAETWLCSMRMEEPYTVAYQSTDTALNVFLKLTTSQGLVGFGCTAPDFQVTGETPKMVLRGLKDVVIPKLIGEDPFFIGQVLDLAQSPSIRNVLDMALHDLIGKAAELPLYKLWGAIRNRVMTSMTIGILPENETVERSRHWVKQGFHCLKIKGGKNWEEDVARVWKVREAVSSEIFLRFDANQGFSREDAIQFGKKVEEACLEFIEQPTTGKSEEELKAVSRHCAVPLMADELALSAADVFRLARDEVCPLVNVKLAKAGGLTALREIAGVAAASNLGLMAGCMDESALGISAGLHFALSTRAVRFADLDGHFGLTGDPAMGTVNCIEGYLYPSEKAGFGFMGGE